MKKADHDEPENGDQIQSSQAYGEQPPMQDNQAYGDEAQEGYDESYDGHTYGGEAFNQVTDDSHGFYYGDTSGQESQLDGGEQTDNDDGTTYGGGLPVDPVYEGEQVRYIYFRKFRF